MSTLTLDSKQVSGSTEYALLVIDDLKLLIPQTQIKSIEMTGDIVVSKKQDLSVGDLQFENRTWPIFCFSSDLSLLNLAPLNHQVCILLQTGSASFGIVCEQILLLKQGLIQPQALPEAMMTDDSPIMALAVYAGAIITISSAEHLAELLALNIANANTEPALCN